MNYYVDEAGLEITEKNIFTAMEIVTLVPMQGKGSLDNFISANNWVKKYFPVNYSAVNHVPEIKRGIFRKLMEKTLGGKTGDAVEKWLMNITGKRWLKKAQRHQLNSKGICMSMIVGRHFSKPDPKNFQDKVVERYHAKVQQLLQQKSTSASLIF
jgi:hypothetical protein